MILEGVCGIIGLLESRKGKFMFHREGSSVVPFEAISNYIEQGFGDCVVSEEILTNKASLLRVNPLDVIGEDGVITERAKAILDEVKSLEQLRYYKNRRNSVKILRGNTTDFERRSLLSGANRDISKGNKLNIEAVFNLKVGVCLNVDMCDMV